MKCKLKSVCMVFISIYSCYLVVTTGWDFSVGFVKYIHVSLCESSVLKAVASIPVTKVLNLDCHLKKRREF